jgi:hypothetical protein
VARDFRRARIPRDVIGEFGRTEAERSEPAR